MYTGFYHTHKLAVLLFVLLYLIKTVLLVANQHAALEKLKKFTRIPEMVISGLFLLTGGYLLVKSAEISTLQIIKLVLVFSAIPVAIVGFKKNNKILAVVSLLLITGAYGLAEINKKRAGKIAIPEASLPAEAQNPAAGEEPQAYVAVGKIVYEQACISCHGKNGDACLAGAKNLQVSKLDDAGKIAIIRNGKNTMPAFKNLTDTQVEALVAYVNTLKDRLNK
jgi:mono/diheme cytochrome c family protein